MGNNKHRGRRSNKKKKNDQSSPREETVAESRETSVASSQEESQCIAFEGKPTKRFIGPQLPKLTEDELEKKLGYEDQMSKIRQKYGDASANGEEELFTMPLRLYGVEPAMTKAKTDNKNVEIAQVEMPPLLLDDFVLEGMPTAFGKTKKRKIMGED